VWWDALCNYISSLGYGTGGADYQRWWQGSSRRIHVVGKGVLRFHAVYWPAMLLSAGQPLPTDVLVHDYLTAGGRKISKSGGVPADPVALAWRYGTDAVRWWLLREVTPTSPRSGSPTGPTRTWPAGSATWPAGPSPWCTGTGTGSCQVATARCPPTPPPAGCEPPAWMRPARCGPRWTGMTSGPRRPRCGGSWTRPTGTSS
jgi:hypothetical protein